MQGRIVIVVNAIRSHFFSGSGKGCEAWKNVKVTTRCMSAVEHIHPPAHKMGSLRTYSIFEKWLRRRRLLGWNADSVDKIYFGCKAILFPKIIYKSQIGF